DVYKRQTHLHAQTHAPGEPPSPSTPASTPTHDLLPAAPTTADGSGAGNSLSNGTTISVAEPASPVISPSEKFQLRQSAFEAISYARGVYANYRRAHELMHEELALYEQLAGELQPRPLYDSLPPWAEQRLRTLYDQWRDAYSAFLDYVAEAARECKDSEQIQQRIADFKQTLMR
ncbi:MAG: hypothetical protein N2651_05630, partial [Fimbriimonadales bacterium]|nr:hypothetical protein [Fimbriimonadales bacterium]